MKVDFLILDVCDSFGIPVNVLSPGLILIMWNRP